MRGGLYLVRGGTNQFEYAACQIGSFLQVGGRTWQNKIKTITHTSFLS